MTDYITPIKDQLDSNMHTECRYFISSENLGKHRSPRWMNFGDFDADTKVLTIQSTQTSNVFFKVDTDFEYIYDVEEFWNQFKRYRTEFLLTNYPTINPY